MKRVIIADVKSSNVNGNSPGHYFTVAKNYQKMFEGICAVKVAGGPIYKKGFSDIIVLKYDTNPEESIIRQKRHILKNCFELFRSCEEDLLVIQSNAVMTVYIALIFLRKRINIFIIQYNQMSISSGLKKMLYNCVKRKIKGIICPTDEIGLAYGLPYCVVPDYCVTKADIRKIPESVSRKEYDFSMVGLITEDKGVVEAARTLAGKRIKVIIAGRPDSDKIRNELKAIEDSCENIVYEPGYISDERYDYIIRNSRYCILNYSEAYSNHSSGVVFDILYRGTPVVGRLCESLRFVSENKLGYVYKNIEDVDFEKIIDDKRDAEYLSNIMDYLNTRLSIPKKLYAFLNDNCRC